MQIDQPAPSFAPRAQVSAWRVRLAWAICAVALALASVGCVLNFQIDRGDWRDPLGLVYALACMVVGGLIISRRPTNLVGWFLLSGACCLITGFSVLQYGLYGTTVRPGALPFAAAIAWTGTVFVPLGTLLIVVMVPLFFPEGRLVSPTWRPVARIAGAVVALLIALNMIKPGNLQDVAGLPNPFGVAALQPWNGVVQVLQLLGLLGLFSLGASSLIVRYRRATGDERLQIKWLTYAVVTWGVVVALTIIAEQISRALFLAADTVVLLVLTMIPVAVGIAVLRYRLYEIDLLINRTLVYGALTACTAALYGAVVVGLGTLFRAQANPLVPLLAAGSAAVVFAPLRTRVQRGVNRMLYGERHEPYAVVSRLGHRLEATLATDAVLPTIVQTVAETLKLPYVAIALHEADGVRVVAEAGTMDHLRSGDHDRPDHTLTVPLTFQGEPIGELRAAPHRPHEAFSEADRRLLRDLARQAGAAVHSVQLTAALETGLADVRRSREHLVMAQEDERRRIQRDLHDGLGPVLASMRLRLEACLERAQAEAPDLAADLEQLDELVGQAATDIRRLVYDLRPPVLDQLGLVPALRQHAARFSRETGLAVDVSAPSDLVLPAAFEVTLFRVAHEALNNVYKHAHAQHVAIQLELLGTALVLRIEDDGVGGANEAEREQGGTGMRSIRERAEYLGGAIVVRSVAGAGTILELYLPLRSN